MENYNLTEHSTIEDFKTYNSLRNRIAELEKNLDEYSIKLHGLIASLCDVLTLHSEEIQNNFNVLKSRIDKLQETFSRGQ